MSRYRFIEAEKVHHAISMLCRVMKVSRAAYYVWSKHIPSAHAVAARQLAGRIKTLHAETNDCYGSPRMHRELRDLDIRVARKRVARLMRALGLSGWTRRRYLGKPTVVPFPPLPDLVRRNFTPSAMNQLWVADITYIRTWEGWLYLAVIMDCYSRRIVGWSMATHLRTELVVEALAMAVAHRRPPAGVIFHGDRGCQYTSMAFGKALRGSGLVQSVGRPATCWDNIVAASFFATLKKELIYRRTWPRRDATQVAVFEYIEAFYNRRRRHSALGYLSPSDFEQRYARVA